jgi:hypothetical protein
MRNTYIRTFLFFFILSTSYAQLSVRNSAYVFVTDEVLYVEDDVNIEETDATLYLRDEAQLIQGSGTTGNSGIGELSVYQTGTVHNYAYNYWASPVGNVLSNTSFNRSFFPSLNLHDVTGLITSNAAGLTGSYNGVASPLEIAQYWLWKYSPGTDYSDWDYVGASNNVTAGFGFTMKGSTGSTAQLYDYRGKPNNGDIQTSVLTGQFTLVGNPYPSAIDAVDYIHDATNTTRMTGTLFFWEQDLSVMSHNLTAYVGGYATYTISSDGLVESFVPAVFNTVNIDGTLNTGGSTSTSGKAVHRYIPIAQGFMVEGTANGSVIFRNSHREYYKQSDANSEFFKTSSLTSENTNSVSDSASAVNELEYNEDGFQILDSEYKRFRLNVDFNQQHTRQLLHNFHASATDGFDYGLESNNSNPNPADAYFMLDETAYIAQAHNFNIDLKIPLAIIVDENMPLTVRIFDVQNFDEQAIYLHDIETNVYYNLNELNFDTNLEAGEYKDRFEITFKDGNESLSVSEFETSNFTIFQNNNVSQLTIKNPDALSIKSLVLYDVTGKRVMQKANLSDNTLYEFPTTNLSDGVYVVNVTLDSKKVINKKVIVINK